MARALPIKARLRPATTGSDLLRPAPTCSDRLWLQKTDFDTKHLKNTNFNKKASINLDFVQKTEKTLAKKFTQSQKIYLVLYLTVPTVGIVRSTSTSIVELEPAVARLFSWSRSR